MARARIQIVFNNCPRCKKPMAGLSRSLTGAESAREKFKGLCSSCVTEAEKQEILEAQAQGLLKMAQESNKQ